MRRKYLIITLILFLAFLLRVYKINANSLYGDEITLAYDTYSIAKTGYGMNGERLPLTFYEAAGRPGGYIYASVPFIVLFGPTEVGVRSLSVLSGVGIVILIFLITKYLFSVKVAYLAAFLASISPWDIALSRTGFEAHFALLMALLGLVTFLYYKKKPWLLIISALSFALAMHTYPTYKFTMPLFILLLLFFKGRDYLFSQKTRKFVIVSLLILSVALLLVVRQTIFTSSEARFADINLFGREDISAFVTQRVNRDRESVKYPAPIEVIFHNKYFEYSKLLITSYFENFNLNFLFVNGDGNPRHNPSELGYFYLVEIIFIIMGFLSLIKNKEYKNLHFILGWIIITPLATMFLAEVHGLRNSLYLPPLLIFSAIGLNDFLKVKKPVRNLVFTIWIALFIIMLERIYFMAPVAHQQFWLRAPKDASLLAMKERAKRDWVIIYDRSGETKNAYAVYAMVDPPEVISQSKSQDKKYDNVLITSNYPQKPKGSGVLIEVVGNTINTYYVD